jgi:uncharacterized alkaline shock family protein YloU
VTARVGDVMTPATSAASVGGTTKIADSVVAHIAALAAREIPGVHDIPTGTGLGQALGRMARQDQTAEGVAVQVGEVECIVDLNIVVDYAVSIPRLAEALRKNVAGRIQAMTGLQTKEVNINVADLYFPGEEKEQEQQQPAVR